MWIAVWKLLSSFEQLWGPTCLSCLHVLESRTELLKAPVLLTRGAVSASQMINVNFFKCLMLFIELFELFELCVCSCVSTNTVRITLNILVNDFKLTMHVQTLITAREMNISNRTEKLRMLRRELFSSSLQLLYNG